MGQLIDLTYFFPWRFIYCISYAFVFYNISRSILKDKYQPLLTFLLILIARCITSEIFFNLYPYDVLGYPAFSILSFIILIFLTQGTIIKKLICTLIGFISTFTSGFTMSVIQNIIYSGRSYEEIFGTDKNMQYDYSYIFLVSCIVNIAISFLFSGILKLLNSKKSKFENKKIYAFISFFPTSHIFIIIFALFLAPEVGNQPDFGFTVNIVLYILMIVILLFDCSFPFIIDYFEKIEEDNINKDREIIKNTMDYHQMLMLKQEKQEFRKIKHDFANIITTAKGFIEIDKPEKAISILSNTNEDLMELAGFSVCSNETINTVLYIKQQQAEKDNIKLDIEIEENCAVLIDDYDLCRLLHNLIDNTLNAVSQIDVDRCCRILIEINNEKLTIKTRNQYKSSKTKRGKKSDEHGNGTGIIKSIVSKYSGKYTYNQINNVWHTETFLINKKPANSTPPPNFGLISK